ncbi:hypothetical protein D3C77_567470 [compost metagenome]
MGQRSTVYGAVNDTAMILQLFGLAGHQRPGMTRIRGRQFGRQLNSIVWHLDANSRHHRQGDRAVQAAAREIQINRTHRHLRSV